MFYAACREKAIRTLKTKLWRKKAPYMHCLGEWERSEVCSTLMWDQHVNALRSLCYCYSGELFTEHAPIQHVGMGTTETQGCPKGPLSNIYPLYLPHLLSQEGIPCFCLCIFFSFFLPWVKPLKVCTWEQVYHILHIQSYNKLMWKSWLVLYTGGSLSVCMSILVTSYANLFFLSEELSFLAIFQSF